MKVEVYPTNKSGGVKNEGFWFPFSSFILYCLFLLGKILVLSTSLLVLFFGFWGTDLVASAAPMSEIQQRGYLNIAVKDNLRPLGFRDEQGNLQGLEIDLAKRLGADLLGNKDGVKLLPVANSDRLSVILDQKVDLAIARITATESRSRIVSLSVPYYFDGAALITKNPAIKDLKDLEKGKIAVLNNSSTIGQVKYYLPNAELVGVDSYIQGREKIESQAVDSFAADGSVLSGWLQTYPEYHILPTKLSTEPLSVVMARGLQYDELRRKVNEAIARYQVTGWLKERTQYWKLP
ncbi:transporter substrate-binding domain-containing protein [Cronbergia sp. UHCC 0137]|uniref:transporter substrate-binding domain-containing protein n=1 Tax=Cronbergia sp. UHCC 0137 TaxID=3110239 RepID=UPI002B1EDD02|nr:transporter substrate-binding domain-containing protein [Cronbergia sp. UHCC 0137]MEA5620091.1 transporter substrate-binding domain-containing protein [Cronbergia sp. UHCC 0137]